jgi:hypothetical protein
VRIQQALTDLDKHAQEFNFPVFDNAYVEFAAARITAFSNPDKWAIIFEVLGFSEREVAFVDDIYAYSSCSPRHGYIGESGHIQTSRESPFFDEKTNACIADWSSWALVVRDKTFYFSPTPDEYSAAGVDLGQRAAGPGTLREIEALRYAVKKLGAQSLLLNDSELLSFLPGCIHLPKLLQTESWEHPDVAAGGRPSDKISIRTLIEAVSANDAAKFNPGLSNVEWRLWPRRSRA